MSNEDYDYEDMNQADVEKIREQALVITKLFTGTFGTSIGQKCLKHLKKAFVDREIYKQGATLDMVAYRQGQADIVKQIIKELEGANNG